MRNIVWAMHPIGLVERLPGASMMRTEPARECGLHRTGVRGFEDVELAQRFRAAGYNIMGRPECMCLHDSDMYRFGEYWSRNVFGGQGTYDILQHTTGKTRWYFWREVRRALLWPVVLGTTLIIAIVLRQPIVAMIGLAVFCVAVVREIRRGWRTGGTANSGLAWAAHWILSKIPYSMGILKAWWADDHSTVKGDGK